MTGLTLLVCSMMVPAQTSQKAAASHAAKPAAPIFEPLERWKNAVLAGDHATLATLYAAMPGAFAQTPQGRSSDPEAEADFWGRLHARGLQAFNPKILQMDTRQPGVVVLTLRIELTMLGGGTTEKPERSVASATQVWVHQSAGWQIYRSQRGVFVDRPAMRLPEPTRPNPNLYPEPQEARKDLDAALAAARADHKRVLVVFGGNWCYDCHVLDEAFHSKDLVPLVTANYHVVHVNVGSYDANLDIAQQCQVVLDKGVPALAVLDADGRVLTSQRNGEFESAVRIGPADVRQFLQEWKPPAGR